MPANPWQLRADTRPVELAAQRWTELSAQMARRAEDLVAAARHATDGWDSAAAESYDAHRRAVLANLDRFTTLADQVAASLRGIASVLASGQKELDQAWTTVALVPHDEVGESRHLVFRPDRDEDQSLVSRAQSGAEEVRGRVRLSLDEEAARLRTARAELVTIRVGLMTLDSTGFPAQQHAPIEVSGVGSVPPGSTSVAGSPQDGIAAGVPPLGPVRFTAPDLGGLTAADLGPLGAAGGAVLGAAGARRAAASGTPAVGGMGTGAMGARAGTTSRAGAAGRAGARRLATPRPVKPVLGSPDGEDEQTRAAREKAAAKDAKRTALEEKRAERAARRAARRSERDEREDDERAEDRTDEDQPDEDALEDSVDGAADGAPGDPGSRPARITVVEHVPGETAEEPRR